MVVKPLEFVAKGRKGLAQPAVAGVGHCTELELLPIGSNSLPTTPKCLAFFIQGCTVIDFGRKLDTLMSDHSADNNRMHSPSPHFSNQGVRRDVGTGVERCQH
jgi:hypothetical protein